MYLIGDKKSIQPVKHLTAFPKDSDNSDSVIEVIDGCYY